jgi:hypothetical protein
MNLGTYQLGDWLPVPLLTGVAWPLDSSGDRVVPTLSIFDENYDFVTRGEDVVPIPTETGLHGAYRRLGPEFAAGFYTAIVEWDDAGNNKAVQRVFRIKPGGHSSGAYVGLHFYEGRNSQYLVGMTDCGLIESRKGPKV